MTSRDHARQSAANQLLILVPAYNEAGSLRTVVDDIRSHLSDCDILVVDDHSTDGTAALLPTLGVHWVRMPSRLGPGAAVRTGLRWADRAGYRYVVRLDGDGQHRADTVASVLEPLQRDTADAVIGSRYADGRAVATPFVRRQLHRLLAWLMSEILDQTITDPTSGLWAFGPRALRLLGDHHPSGYPEPELLLFLARNGMRFREVAVSMRERQSGESSLTPQRSGAALARLLLLLVVVPLRATVPQRHE